MKTALRRFPDERRRRMLRRLRIHPLFRRMALRLGVNLGGTWSRGLERLLLDALDRCAACAQARSCQAWQARTPAGPFYPAFCPVGPTLNACRMMEAGAAADGAPADDAPPPPSLTEMLDDPLVRQVMRAARPNTRRLIAVLDGAPRRLVERLSAPP